MSYAARRQMLLHCSIEWRWQHDRITNFILTPVISSQVSVQSLQCCA